MSWLDNWRHVHRSGLVGLALNMTSVHLSTSRKVRWRQRRRTKGEMSVSFIGITTGVRAACHVDHLRQASVNRPLAAPLTGPEVDRPQEAKPSLIKDVALHSLSHKRALFRPNFDLSNVEEGTTTRPVSRLLADRLLVVNNLFAPQTPRRWLQPTSLRL